MQIVKATRRKLSSSSPSTSATPGPPSDSATTSGRQHTHAREWRQRRWRTIVSGASANPRETAAATASPGSIAKTNELAHLALNLHNKVQFALAQEVDGAGADVLEVGGRRSDDANGAK